MSSIRTHSLFQSHRVTLAAPRCRGYYYAFEMTSTYLGAILDAHRRRAERDQRPWRDRLGAPTYVGPSLYDVVRGEGSDYVTVIAEIKRRSPAKGWLNKDLDAVALARTYCDAGAGAISVLTDAEHFAGSLYDLEAIHREVPLALLRKDFTVCENDVLDARDAGAAAVLLIVAALSDDELLGLIELTARCGLEALVEVHESVEVSRALDVGARIVGVNQRNLHTFQVDPQHAAALVESIPPTCVTVCESGVATTADVKRAAASGFDAVLVGEAFVTSDSPATVVRDFAQVARRRRG